MWRRMIYIRPLFIRPCRAHGVLIGRHALDHTTHLRRTGRPDETPVSALT